MTSLAIGTTSLLVSLCVVLHMAVSFVLFWRLAFDGAATRSLFTQPWLPTYCEVTAIALVILGTAMRQMDLAYIGGVILALGLVLRNRESAQLPRVLQLPLLLLAIAAFTALLLFFATH